MYDKVAKYLRRIGCSGSAEPTLDFMNELQQCHIYTVPYENIDIMLHKPLSMEMDAIYTKVVDCHRGGYCFELNGLFGWLLGQLGFKVTEYTARFLLNESNIPMRRHRVNVADLEGERYLCDVGVGIEVPRQAVKLVNGLEQEICGTIYRMDWEDFYGWVLNENYKGEWRRIHSFTLEPQLPIDFVMPSFYCEKHPDSIFNRAPMLSIKTPEGRITLDGNLFKIFTPNGIEQFIADSTEVMSDRLKLLFGLDIPVSDCERMMKNIVNA